MRPRTALALLASSLIAGLTLLALGAGLLTLGLTSELDGSAYYDGDGDDAGMVQERITPAPHVATVQPLVPFVPVRVTQRSVQRHSLGSPSVSLPACLVPRGPPSRSLLLT